jgi:tRNA A37 threonylcarbamoyladenosine modification protein TsaB|tara:strand:+ start:1262 stop:1645 length:384 start_codon:yes stop_codon:yes gene_type:complete
MIKDFLILNCIGKSDKIGLKVDDNFFIHDFNNKVKNNDQLVISILNLIKKHKVIFDQNFTVLVNSGPGSFSSIRVALAVARGIKLSKNINLFGFKNSDLGQFSLANVELLIKKQLIQKKLIKPLYLS